MKRMCEETKQMLQKICDSDEQAEKTKEEGTQVAGQHSAVQTKLSPSVTDRGPGSAPAYV